MGKEYYLRFYKIFLQENAKDNFGKEVYLDFDNEYLSTILANAETKVSTIEITKIVELPDLMMIMVKGGKSLLVAMNNVVESEDLRMKLKDLAKYIKVEYSEESDWKWK